MARRSSRGSVYNKRVNEQVQVAKTKKKTETKVVKKVERQVKQAKTVKYQNQQSSSSGNTGGGGIIPQAHAQVQSQSPQARTQTTQYNPLARVAQFAHNVGRGAVDTGKSYTTDFYDMAEAAATGRQRADKSYQDETLFGVFGRGLFEGNLGGSLDEASRRITHEPGRVVGEVAAETAIMLGTMGLGAALKGVRIGGAGIKAGQQFIKTKSTAGVSKTKIGKDKVLGTKRVSGYEKNTSRLSPFNRGGKEFISGDFKKGHTLTIKTNKQGKETAKLTKDLSITGWTRGITSRSTSMGNRFAQRAGRTQKLILPVVTGGSKPITFADNLPEISKVSVSKGKVVAGETGKFSDIDSPGAIGYLKQLEEFRRGNWVGNPEAGPFEGFAWPTRSPTKGLIEDDKPVDHLTGIMDTVIYEEGQMVTGQVGKLKEGQIIIVPTNTEGRHGSFMAKQGLKEWGMVPGQAEGYQGQTLGVITKRLKTNKDNKPQDPLTKAELQKSIWTMITSVKSKPNTEHLLPAIGTGAAGWEAKTIMKLFGEEIVQPNMVLPEQFRNLLSPSLLGKYTNYRQNARNIVKKKSIVDEEAIKSEALVFAKKQADGSYKDVEYRATTKFSDITLEPGTEAIANKLLIKYTKEINKSKVLMDVGERPKIIKSKSARDVEIKGQSKDDFGISSNYLTDEELMTESYGGMFDPNNIQGILLNASPSSFPINKDKVIIMTKEEIWRVLSKGGTKKEAMAGARKTIDHYKQDTKSFIAQSIKEHKAGMPSLGASTPPNKFGTNPGMIKYDIGKMKTEHKGVKVGNFGFQDGIDIEAAEMIIAKGGKVDGRMSRGLPTEGDPTGKIGNIRLTRFFGEKKFVYKWNKKQNKMVKTEVNHSSKTVDKDGKTLEKLSDRTGEVVKISDGVVAFFEKGKMGPGTAHAKRVAKEKGIPWIENPTAAKLNSFTKKNNIQSLGIVGSRGSTFTPALKKRMTRTLMGVKNKKTGKWEKGLLIDQSDLTNIKQVSGTTYGLPHRSFGDDPFKTANNLIFEAGGSDVVGSTKVKGGQNVGSVSNRYTTAGDYVAEQNRATRLEKEFNDNVQFTKEELQQYRSIRNKPQSEKAAKAPEELRKAMPETIGGFQKKYGLTKKEVKNLLFEGGYGGSPAKIEAELKESYPQIFGDKEAFPGLNTGSPIAKSLITNTKKVKKGRALTMEESQALGLENVYTSNLAKLAKGSDDLVPPFDEVSALTALIDEKRISKQTQMVTGDLSLLPGWTEETGKMVKSDIKNIFGGKGYQAKDAEELMESINQIDGKIHSIRYGDSYDLVSADFNSSSIMPYVDQELTTRSTVRDLLRNTRYNRTRGKPINLEKLRRKNKSKGKGKKLTNQDFLNIRAQPIKNISDLTKINYPVPQTKKIIKVKKKDRRKEHVDRVTGVATQINLEPIDMLPGGRGNIIPGFINISNLAKFGSVEAFSNPRSVALGGIDTKNIVKNIRTRKQEKPATPEPDPFGYVQFGSIDPATYVVKIGPGRLSTSDKSKWNNMPFPSWSGKLSDSPYGVAEKVVKSKNRQDANMFNLNYGMIEAMRSGATGKGSNADYFKKAGLRPFKKSKAAPNKWVDDMMLRSINNP